MRADFGNGIHAEKAKGNDKQNFEYCSKDNDYQEFGTRKETTGKNSKRTDIWAAVEAANSGMSFQDLMVDPAHCETVARCMNYFTSLYRNLRERSGIASIKEAMENATLQEWQTRVIDLIKDPVDPRKVYWFWDERGGIGKSFLCNYLIALHNAQVFSSGRLSDMAHALREDASIVIIDLARQTEGEDFKHWARFVENVKDQRMFSPKYESTTKFLLPKHVLIFANFYPTEYERNKLLSEDRWFEVDLNQVDRIKY